MKTKLAIAATTLIAAFAAGATDFVWTGNTQYAEDWFDNDNWTVDGEVPEEGVYPGADDTATFDKDAALNVNSEITVGKLILNANLTHKRDKWLTIGAIEGSGELILSHRGRLRNVSGTAIECNNNILITESDGSDWNNRGSMPNIQANQASFVIKGKLLGDGHVFFTMDSYNGVQLYGDNSEFTGTVHIDSNASNRVKLGAAQAAPENGTWHIYGNTGDNGGTIEGSAGGTFKFGSLIADARNTGNYPFRFKNLTSTAVLEIGNLNSENDIISIRMGENNNTTGHAQIKKVGTGTLELWHTGHIRGTVISNGTLLVTSADALNGRTDNSTSVNGDCTVTFMGGTLKYGRDLWTDKDNPADVTTDWSALVRNSTEFISVDTDGKDITWASAAIHSSNADAKGFEKKGEGTLALTGLDGTVTFPLFTQSSKTNYIHGGTLEIINERNGNTRDFTAKMLGTGTLRLIDSSSDNSGFRLRPNDAFSEFGGTVEWAKTKHLNDKAYGFMLNNGNLDMSNICFRVTGSPEEPRTVMKGETGTGNTVTVGAFDHLSPNAQLAMTGNWNLNILGTKGDSYMNGVFSNKTVTITKTGTGKLTIGSGFAAPDGSKINVNEGVLALGSGTTATALSSYLTIASDVALTGDGVFGAVNLSANDVVAPEASTITDKTKEYPILTATSFIGTSANLTALLATLNANETKGKWKVRKVNNGDGTFTLKCVFAPPGFAIVIR